MFDEGPRPDMVIRTRGAILGRTKVTSRAGDEDAEVAVDLQASHRSFCRSHSGTLNESTNVGVKTGGSRVGGPKQCVLGSMARLQIDCDIGFFITGSAGHLGWNKDCALPLIVMFG